jgi:hypothetical protein
MNTQSKLFQRIGGLGIVYAALFVAAMVLTGNQPGAGASGATVVRYYHSHRVAWTATTFVTAALAIVFTFFLASVRRSLSRTTEGRQLSTVVTAGGAVYAGGLLLMGALGVALVDAANHHMTAAAQTLNVLSTDDWVPVVAGLSIVALGTGIAALRGATLPRWLAWASIGLGILAVAGPLGGVAFLITPVWTLATGIVLLRISSTDESTEAAETAPPSSERHTARVVEATPR